MVKEGESGHAALPRARISADVVELVDIGDNSVDGSR